MAKIIRAFRQTQRAFRSAARARQARTSRNVPWFNKWSDEVKPATSGARPGAGGRGVSVCGGGQQLAKTRR